MKPMLNNLLTIILCASIISSCSNKKADLLIPKEAAMIVHINANSLSSKISWNEIRNSDWFKYFNKENTTDEFEKKLMEDPENSGVDLKSDMYFFVKPSGQNAYIAFQGKLKDAKAFETMVKKMNDGKEIRKDGNINYSGEGLDIMTWTNDRFMMVGQAQMEQGLRGYKTAGLTKDSILNFAKATYELKSSNSIAGNSKLNSLLNEKGDIHFWINNDIFLRQSMQMGLSIFKASSVLEGNTTGFTVNFENGKISGTSHSWYNKELGDFMKKYKPGNLNTDMLKKIPSGNVDAVIAMNYPPEGVKAFLKLLGIDGLADSYLTKAGVNLDDLINANKGDLLLAVTDFGMKEKTEPGNGPSNVYSYENRPDAKILFATSINNKGAFDKLVDAVKTTMSKEGVQGSEAFAGIKYEFKDNWFVAGNSQDVISAYGSGPATDHPFISKISGHPFGVYVDFRKFIAGVGPQKMGQRYGLPSNEMNTAMSTWEDMVIYGGEIEDGAGIGHFEINMTDKNTNSLKQLFNFVGSMSRVFMGAFENRHAERFQFPDSTGRPDVILDSVADPKKDK